MFGFRAQAQYILSGTVTDANDGAPLYAVTIYAPDQLKGTISDDTGHYRLEFSERPDSIHFRYIGYEALVLVVPPMQADHETVLNAGMKEDIPIICAYPIVIQERMDYSGPMDFVEAEELLRSDNSSLAPTLNQVPGVQFDERGPGGSRRLGIRGAFLRSPFGVRNIKVYYDGAPLTSPDGATPMEVVDVLHVRNIDIHKGPGGSQYGAGTAGAMTIAPRRYIGIGNLGGGVGLVAGSYGYQRLHAAASGYGITSAFTVNYVRQQYAGYRDQEANNKDQLTISARKDIGENHRLTFTGYLYDGKWELPGAINQMTVDSNPQAANPNSVAFDAHVRRRRARAILGHRFRRDRFFVETRLYVNATDKINPYGTSPFFNGYKDEAAWGIGGRSAFQYRLLMDGRQRLVLDGAVEYQSETLDFEEYDNNNGEAGALRHAEQTISSQMLAALGLLYRNGDHRVHARTSVNLQQYRTTDLAPDSVDFSGNIRFDPVFLPSFSYRFTRFSASYFIFWAKLALGYSPPGLWELRRGNGALDANLRPEYGFNAEVRARLRFWKQRMRAELSLYRFRLQDAILPRDLNTGETIYENTGSTKQDGFEAWLSFELEQRGPFRKLEFGAGSSIQLYSFGDYTINGESFAGNLLTGVPRWTLSGRADLTAKAGTYLRMSLNAVGRTPYDNANTTFREAYALLNGRLGQDLNFFKEYGDHPTNLTVELFGGVNNILDASYTSFMQLNGAFGRLFNPAPGRNYYIGATLRF